MIQFIYESKITLLTHKDLPNMKSSDLTFFCYLDSIQLTSCNVTVNSIVDAK